MLTALPKTPSWIGEDPLRDMQERRKGSREGCRNGRKIGGN